MIAPLVTIARPAWRALIAQTAGHAREGSGLVIGQRTRHGNFRIALVLGVTHIRADEGHVYYDTDEVARAKISAYEMYKPLEPLGMFHSHPWPSCNINALAPQISDDWRDPKSDVTSMLDGDLEVIVATFPWPGYWLSRKEFLIQTKLGKTMCRVETWLRVKRGKVIPCRIGVR